MRFAVPCPSCLPPGTADSPCSSNSRVPVSCTSAVRMIAWPKSSMGLYLGLHPGNVLLGVDGLVVIDYYRHRTPA